MERLTQAINLTGGDHYILLYGPGVSDVFISPRYTEVNLVQALWELLKAAGFERIAVISPHQGLYFLDEQSRNLSLPAPAVSPGKVPAAGGPLKRSSFATTASPASASAAPAPQNNPRAVGDESSLSLANAMMHDDTHRTAILFTQAETLLHYFDSPRLLSARAGSWAHLRTTNKNVSIWLFSGSIQHLTDILQTTMPEMHTFLTRRSVSGYNVAAINGPERAELTRLVEHVRLRDKISMNWEDRDNLVEWLSSEGKLATEWLAAIRKAGAFSLDTARKQKWMEALPSGKTALERLDELVGLDSVKEQVRKWIARVEIDAKRREAGLLTGAENPCLHMVFKGNPGTGKTEVARLMGEICRNIGLLRRGHLVEAGETSDLVAGYVGQTAIRTNELVDSALDGVLFIDEAYRLSQDQHGFGQEAVNTLLTRMENDRARLAVIAAGYPKEMDDFIKSNPGLNRRFVHQIVFPDYTPAELVEILRRMLIRRGMTWTDEMTGALEETVDGLYAMRTPQFGNAGEMRKLTELLEQSWCSRIKTEGLPVNTPLVPADIPSDYETARERGQEQHRHTSEEDVMKELDALVGMENVKDHVRRLYSRLLIEQKLRANGGQTSELRLHLVFTGNPGTGKTTVARLLGEVYRTLGLLRRGHLVEVDTPAKLIAGYVGQTSERTNQLIDEALDGVLFVDEAYQLADTQRGGFVSEARDTLLVRMENERNRLAVIVAGYPAEMDHFLDSNPGLRSRVGETIHFPDYSDGELLEILRRHVAKAGYRIEDDALLHAQACLIAERNANPSSFGNARSVINLFEKMKTNLAERLVNRAASFDINDLCIERGDVPPA